MRKQEETFSIVYLQFTVYYSPSSSFVSSWLRFLLIRNWFVKMRMGKRPEEWKRSELLAHTENINKSTNFSSIQNYFPHAPLLLANGLLSIPALEENLFWVGVKKTHLQYYLVRLGLRSDEVVTTHHSEICDHFCPRDVELE